jgi:hypothetical protein
MHTYVIASCAVLLLLGAGCANTDTPTNVDNPIPSVKEAESNTDTAQAEASETSNTPLSSDIRLTATQTTNTSVTFEWELPEDTTYEGFIIVRSLEPNPEHSGKNYWFRQHPSRRSVTWTPLPKGEWNFRICGLKHDECSVYSNNVTAIVE